MSAPVRTVSNTPNAQGTTSLSLTQLCQTNTPKEVLKAIEQGALPDPQTLVEACKKLQAARQRCGSFDPSSDYVSDEVCADFYSWFSVVHALIKHKAPITEGSSRQGLYDWTGSSITHGTTRKSQKMHSKNFRKTPF